MAYRFMGSQPIAAVGLGVKEEHIEVAGICTYRAYESFFSARRMGIRSGRILSGIMLHK